MQSLVQNKKTSNYLIINDILLIFKLYSHKARDRRKMNFDRLKKKTK